MFSRKQVSSCLEQILACSRTDVHLVRDHLVPPGRFSSLSSRRGSAFYRSRWNPTGSKSGISSPTEASAEKKKINIAGVFNDLAKLQTKRLALWMRKFFIVKGRCERYTTGALRVSEWWTNEGSLQEPKAWSALADPMSVCTGASDSWLGYHYPETLTEAGGTGRRTPGGVTITQRLPQK